MSIHAPVTVAISVYAITGLALPFARVTFSLTAADINSGIVAPGAIPPIALDANGLGSASLWPNASGTQGTQYRFELVNAAGELQISGLATVPNTNCNLHDILTTPAPQTIGDAQAAANAAQASRLAADADVVLTGLDRIATAADRVQTDLDAAATAADKAAILGTLAPITVLVSRDLTAADLGRPLTCINALTLTIPAGLPIGFSCAIEQAGTGQVTVAAGAGVTLRNVDTQFKTSSKYAMCGITNVASETYNLSGATAA